MDKRPWMEEDSLWEQRKLPPVERRPVASRRGRSGNMRGAAESVARMKEAGGLRQRVAARPRIIRSSGTEALKI